MLDVESATRLRGVVSRIARRLNSSATSEGLTPTQASVLGLIVSRGPLGLGQLTELEGLNPTMLSRVIGALTSAGLIVRQPDPSDQRAQLVEATAQGARVHERIKSARARYVSDATAELPEDQLEALLNALPALEALAGRLNQPTPQAAARSATPTRR
jgi:DNA-binding MarR family transcriptional regulator